MYIYSRRKYYWCPKIQNYFFLHCQFVIFFQYCNSNIWLYSVTPHLVLAFPTFGIVVAIAKNKDKLIAIAFESKKERQLWKKMLKSREIILQLKQRRLRAIIFPGSIEKKDSTLVMSNFGGIDNIFVALTFLQILLILYL